MNGDGVELAVNDEGDGPAVLLLHGFPDSARLWRHQIPALKDAGSASLRPTCAASATSDKPQDVDAYRVGHSVADLLAVLDALEIEKAHVVGHDWGAGVAWALALMAPRAASTGSSCSRSATRRRSRAGLEQREKSWYMLLFQFAEAEELLRQDDWALLREWVGEPPGPRRARSRTSTAGRADRGAQLVPREPAPARRARSRAAVPAVQRRHARRLEQRRRATCSRRG